MNWHLALGLGEENYKFHDHEKLAHYANAAADIEFKFPFGFKELEGIHSRTDFDLKAHEKHSGRKLQYFDPERNESYVPYVVETSVGLDRLFLALFSNCLKEELLEDGSERTVLSLPPALAPVKAAILPLMKIIHYSSIRLVAWAVRPAELLLGLSKFMATMFIASLSNQPTAQRF